MRNLCLGLLILLWSATLTPALCQASELIDVDQLFEFCYCKDLFVGFSYSSGTPYLLRNRTRIAGHFGIFPFKDDNKLKNVGFEFSPYLISEKRGNTWQINLKNNSANKVFLNNTFTVLYWHSLKRSFSDVIIEGGLGMNHTYQEISGFKLKGVRSDQIGYRVGMIGYLGIGVKLISGFLIGTRLQQTVFFKERYRRLRLSFSLIKVIKYERKRK